MKQCVSRSVGQVTFCSKTRENIYTRQSKWLITWPFLSVSWRHLINIYLNIFFIVIILNITHTCGQDNFHPSVLLILDVVGGGNRLSPSLHLCLSLTVNIHTAQHITKKRRQCVISFRNLSELKKINHIIRYYSHSFSNFYLCKIEKKKII